MDVRKHSGVNGGAYFLATASAIIGEMNDLHVLVYVCRPAMMLILSSWFFFNSRRVGDRFTLLIQAGLFFSLIGDVALMFQHRDEFNFLIGLGAYLIAVLCYTMAIIHNITDVGGEAGVLVPLIIALGLSGLGFLFTNRLMAYLDDGAEIPILVFVIASIAMAIAAGFRFGRTFVRSFLMVQLGALFLLSSNALLLTNRFMLPLDHSSWSILLTYSIAQYLIVAGCLLHVLDPEEIRRKAALST